MSYTPGPWALHVDGVLVLGAGPNPQAVVDCETSASPNLRRAEREANARLIAAAPELLEACKRLLTFNEELAVDIGVSAHYPSAGFARAAIAKAEGDAS